MVCLNEEAIGKVMSLDKVDAAYCMKLAKHFKHMGLADDMASGGIASMIDCDAVPDSIPALPVFASLKEKFMSKLAVFA